MSDSKMTNADLMRAMRKRFGLTQPAAGVLLGISPRTVEAIEYGRRRVDDRVLMLALKNIKKSDVEALQSTSATT